MAAIVDVSHLNVTLEEKQILHDVNFSIQEEETVAVIGPNGAGKTTLFRALLGLVPYEGKIVWKQGIKIGYVPQKLYIGSDLPLTTQEFFSFKEKNQNEIHRVLSAVGLNSHGSLSGVLAQKLGVLSSGELQKVLIAWALLGRPDVLLFDEPTSGIDVSMESTIYSLLHNLQKEEKLTVILISHELEIVYKFATNVICLNKESVCFGSPKTVMDKKNLEKTFGSDIAFYKHH